jgi:hypothetical protein
MEEWNVNESFTNSWINRGFGLVLGTAAETSETKVQGVLIDKMCSYKGDTSCARRASRRRHHQYLPPYAAMRSHARMPEKRIRHIHL